MALFPFICRVKVLILHQHFNTPKKGGAIRSYYLAKALVDHGIETTVITGCNAHVYRNENYEGIEVHYLPVAYDNSFGFIARGISFLKYVWSSVRLARKIKSITICYAISTPLTTGIAALWLKRKTKLPYIFEVGDLWPDAPIQMGFVKNYFLILILKKLEKEIYYNAASIVALSQPIKEAIEKKISGKKIHIISNIADCDFYKPEPKSHQLEQKFKMDGKFIISYLGAAGVANGLDYLIECANASRKANLPIHFILCGDGAMLPYLKSSAEKLVLENISFTGFVDRDAVKEVMNITDAVFVSFKNVPILETGSPNKYFDGLAAGKVIVLNFGGWIRDEIELTGCGISLDPRHPTDFIKKIDPYLNNKKMLMDAQHASRRIAEEKYSRKKIAASFASIFKEFDHL